MTLNAYFMYRSVVLDHNALETKSFCACRKASSRAAGLFRKFLLGLASELFSTENNLTPRSFGIKHSNNRSSSNSESEEVSILAKRLFSDGGIGRRKKKRTRILYAGRKGEGM